MRSILFSAATAAVIGGLLILKPFNSTKVELSDSGTTNREKGTTYIASSEAANGAAKGRQVGTVASTDISIGNYSPIPEDLFGFNTQFSRLLDPWTSTRVYTNFLKSTKARIFRYPGGTNSSFWDCLNDDLLPDKSSGATSGWMDYSIIKNNFVSKMVLQNNHQKNSLRDVEAAVNATGATPIFVLNMLTPTQDYYQATGKFNVSDWSPGSKDRNNSWWKILDDKLDRNLNMLRRAKALGIPVRYIELGNEYYAQNAVFNSVFPDGITYAKAANYFARRIKREFPDVQFAAVCSQDDRPMKNFNRSVDWNSQVMSVLDRSIITAITIHAYEATDKTNYGNEKDLADGLDHWNRNLRKAFQNTSVDRVILNAGMKVWYTEYEAKYSMEWENVKAPGNNNKLWANSLISAYGAFYLQGSANASKILYHKMDDIISDKGKLLAKGSALIPILKAASGMNEAASIDFTNLPPKYNSRKPVIGYVYKNGSTIHCAFINFSGSSLKLNLSSLFKAGSVTLESYSNNSLMSIDGPDVNSVSSSPSTITLPPYSSSWVY